MAGGIAHDFSNILQAISGYLQLGLKRAHGDEKLEHYLEEARASTRRAGDLVAQILAFSRLQDRERIPLLVAPILKEALKTFRASVPASIEIRQSVAAECDPVRADPVQIHQLITTLLTNAFQGMRLSGGVLKVSLVSVDLDGEDAPQFPDLTPGRYIRLEVADTGCGTDGVTGEGIPEPFSMASGEEGSTGMGLASVQSIVKGHGGDVSVSSEPGRGTTLAVYLPVHSPDRVPQAAVLPGTVRRRGTERILFVDDETTLLDLAREGLSALGYQVTTCGSSLEALAVFQADPRQFDVVVTDLAMPHMDGLQTSEALLLMRADTPIILCTAFSEKLDEGRARGVGIRDYVLKPVVPDDLALAIRRAIDEK